MKIKKSIWPIIATLCLTFTFMLCLSACGNKTQDCTIIASVQERTYNGQEQGLVLGTDFTIKCGNANVTDAKVNVTYKEKESESEYSVEIPKYAGSYTAKIVVSANNKYKEAVKEVDFEIKKFQITDLNREYAFFMSSDGSLKMATLSFDRIKSDPVYVVYNFEKMEVGATTTNITLQKTRTVENIDKILNSYNLVLDNAIGKIVARQVKTSELTMAHLTVSQTLGEFFTPIKCTRDMFFDMSKSDEDEGRELYIIISNTNTWEDGDEIPVVVDATKYVKGTNELASLSGINSNAYEFVANNESESFKVKYVQTKTSYTGTVKNKTNIVFGNEDFIVYGAKNFVVSESTKTSYRSIVYTSDGVNDDKQVTYSIYAGENKIAELKRVGLQIDAREGYMHYDFFGGTFGDVATFDLLKNVEGYTDSQGRWICKDKTIDLTMQISFDDIKTYDLSSSSNISEIGKGMLTSGSILVFKVVVCGDDQTYTKITASSGLDISIKVFNADEDGNGYMEEGQEISNAGTGILGEEEVFTEPIYVYVYVNNGSNDASLTLSQDMV